MERILISFILFSLLACNSEQKENTFRNKLEFAISKVDSNDSFNGVIGILRKNEEPILVFKGNESPIDSSPFIDSNDYFHLASNSKLFTGLATLKMMKDYDLNYKSPIGPYFPELHPNLQRVTIQQLANHTSAIHDFFSLIENPSEVTNEEAMEVLIKLDTTVYEPGLKWGYTNSSYVLLSLLIERVTKTPYNIYLDQEILSPLGIEDAQFHPNSMQSLNGYVHGKLTKPASLTTGDAGVYMTTNHILKFFDHQEVHLDFINQAKQFSSPWTDDSWRYGFGWFFSEDSIGKFRAHSGRSGGFESYIRVYESNDLMLFMLSNNELGIAKSIRNEILDMLIKEL